MMVERFPVVPQLVERAHALAAELNFSKSCSDGTGALLRTLAAAADGTALELGTGCGVGSAWLLSGLPEGVQLVSVDANPELVGATAARLEAGDRARFLVGDWRTALTHGPFSLVFVDVGEAKDEGADEVIAAVVDRGLIVLDDFEPGPYYRGEPDERWLRWMRHPRLVCSEVLLAPGVALLLAAKRRLPG